MLTKSELELLAEAAANYPAGRGEYYFSDSDDGLNEAIARIKLEGEACRPFG